MNPRLRAHACSHFFATLLFFFAGGRAPHAAEPVLTPPVLKVRVEAVYPELAAAAGREGTVILELLVDPTGQVTHAEVVARAGFGLDEAALDATRQFQFEPGRYDGKPVPVKVTYRYAFRLPRKAAPAKGAEAPHPEDPVRLSGQIQERGTRTPLDGVAVTVLDPQGMPLGRGDSDASGRFAVRLPPKQEGEVQVVVATPGHKTLKLREKLRAREALTVKYSLSRDSYAQYESTVRGQPAREEVGRVSLSGDEIRRIPGTRGDALAAALNLPSVARSPFDLGQLVIRGSQPGESGAFLLGMGMPQPFHFALGTSTFNSFLLERFDLIPSNFSVRYGRFVGGVLDVVPREGRRDRIHGDLKVDLYDAHLIVEGPIKKGSFALSFRRSYADAILGLVLPTNSLTVAPRYYDYQGLFDYPLGGGKFKLILFGSDDALALVQGTPPDADPSLRGEFSTHLLFHRITAGYTKKWGRFELESTIFAGYTHEEAALGLAARFNLDLVEADLRTELRYNVSPRFKLTGGLDVQTDYFWASVDAPNITTEEKPQGPLSIAKKTNIANQGFEPYPALYAQAEMWATKKLVLIPGVRVDWFSAKKGTYVQPRLMARLEVAEKTWLKAGAGLFHQPVQAPYDDPVLGNPRIHPEQAIHLTVGVETSPFRKLPALRLEVNLFYKDLRYLVVSSDAGVVRNNKIVPELYDDEGIGRVYGGDFLLKQDNPRYLFGWVAYTLLKSERQDHPGAPFRPFQYDQTHILTAVAGYHLPRDFDLGLRFRYVTGNPDTALLATGMTLYDSDHDTYLPHPAAPYSSRLPDFIQLDVRIDKRFVFKSWIFSVYLDVSNVTNRSNVEGYAYSYDYTRRVAVTGLPILPSLGLRASF